jgi:hypothetical protein
MTNFRRAQEDARLKGYSLQLYVGGGYTVQKFGAARDDGLVMVRDLDEAAAFIADDTRLKPRKKTPGV